jgi:hypothetical protein
MRIYFSLLSAFLLISVQVFAQKRIANNAYQIEVAENGTMAVKHLISGKTFNLQPQFTVMQSASNPKLSFVGQASRFMKNEIGAVRVPHWDDPLTKKPQADFFKAATPVVVKASSIMQESGVLKLNFEGTANFLLTAVISLKETTEPTLSFEFTAKKEGYYTIGFTGIPEFDPSTLDAVWQPPICQDWWINLWRTCRSFRDSIPLALSAKGIY